MRQIFTALLVLAALYTQADVRADNPPTTQPVEAPTTQPMPQIIASDTASLKSNYGKHVIVSGKVRSAAMAKSGKVFRIDFDGVANDGYLAVIFAADFKDVDATYTEGLAKAITGKTIEITGLVEDYRGRPESIIRSAKQLKIVEPAAK